MKRWINETFEVVVSTNSGEEFKHRTTFEARFGIKAHPFGMEIKSILLKGMLSATKRSFVCDLVMNWLVFHVSSLTLFVLLLFLGPRTSISRNGDRGAPALVVQGERLDAVPLTGNQPLHVPLRPR